MPFKNEKSKNIHEKVFYDHIVVKRLWSARFLDLFFSLPLNTMLRLIGMSLIYFTTMNHFNVSFNCWESAAIGLGIGLFFSLGGGRSDR
jgi:hypothetical protein